VNTSTRNVVRSTIQTGTLTNLGCAAAAALMGAAERGSPILPINAISHVVWGDRDRPRPELSWHDTATGLVVNQAACSFWAWLHLALLPSGQGSLARVVTQAAAISFAAYVTDYHVVPRRFTPGFEKVLPRTAFLQIYAAIAAGLAVGSLLDRS
jgi:hypothetical protein